MRAFRVWLLLATTVAVAMSGCVDGGAGSFTLEDDPEVPFVSIENGSWSRYKTPGFHGEVATDGDEWRRLWAKHTSQHPVPEVDFASQFVVAAFMGRQNTGGYAIDVVDMSLAEGTFHAGYVTVRPGPGCGTLQAVTYPFHFVAVDRMNATEIDVVFQDVGQNVREC